jgi:hypothetical protein
MYQILADPDPQHCIKNKKIKHPRYRYTQFDMTINSKKTLNYTTVLPWNTMRALYRRQWGYPPALERLPLRNRQCCLDHLEKKNTVID